MLSLRMAVTNKVKSSLSRRHLYLKPCKISYRGVPAWLKLGVFSSELPALAALACAKGASMFSRKRTRTLWLACANCSIRTDVQNTTLFCKGKWATLKCGYCGHSSSVRKWWCVCGLPWHGCKIHAKSRFACRTHPRHRALSHSSTSKRDLGPSNAHPIPSLLMPLHSNVSVFPLQVLMQIRAWVVGPAASAPQPTANLHMCFLLLLVPQSSRTKPVVAPARLTELFLLA